MPTCGKHWKNGKQHGHNRTAFLKSVVRGCPARSAPIPAPIAPIPTRWVMLQGSISHKSHRLTPSDCNTYLYLVCGLNPSEKYWSIGMIIPNIWENKKCSKPPTRYIYIYISRFRPGRLICCPNRGSGLANLCMAGIPARMKGWVWPR